MAPLALALLLATPAAGQPAGPFEALRGPAPLRSLRLPCGAYTLDTARPIEIEADGVTVQGAGPCTELHLAGPGDAFVVRGALFRLRDLEVRVDSTSARTGALVHAIGSQGALSGLRVTGQRTSPDNGMLLLLDGDGADDWSVQDVRVTGGTRWTNLLRLTTARGTVASTFVSGLRGSFLAFRRAAIELEGAVDTLLATLLALDVSAGQGPVFWLHARPGAAITPRWVHCSACTAEAAGTTALRLEAGRDFRWVNAYVATARVGVEIGPQMRGVSLQAVEFVNLEGPAVVVAGGASDVVVQGSSFEEVCRAPGAAPCAAVQVEAAAQAVRIVDNAFREVKSPLSLPPKLPADWAVRGNLVPGGAEAPPR